MIKVGFIDIGPGSEQVNIGTLPDSESDQRVALTQGEQTFHGAKNFEAVVGSPNSAQDIFSADDEDLVTYEQLATYRDRIESQIVETGFQFGNMASVHVDDAGGTVTFNPPIVETPTTGKIVYRGRTSRGRTFVHAFFRELSLKYQTHTVNLLTPTLVRVYTSAEPPTPLPPDPGSGGSGGGGNSHVPKECPPVTIEVSNVGTVTIPGKIIWMKHGKNSTIVCYRPNEC